MDMERRLGDRIVYALELALDQQDLEVSELLAKALEISLTRFGGEGVVEKRALPDSVPAAFDRLDQLRHAKLGGREAVV